MLGCNQIKKTLNRVADCDYGDMFSGKRKKKCAATSAGKRTKAESAIPSSGNSLQQITSDGYTATELLNCLNRSGIQSLNNEFLKLRNEKVSGTFNTSLAKENTCKNRYMDILCLDQTRVVLDSRPGGNQPLNYINANFVNGYKQKNAYIATQGPLPQTCKDFWEMIFEQNVCVIVMTTRTVEKGFQKCAQYWPKKSGKTNTYGNFTVFNQRVNVIEHFIETELVIHNVKTKEKHSVVHLFFTSWPDHGVPSSAKDFMSFLLHVRERQTEQVAKLSANDLSLAVLHHPIVVHCSAGIGRTGTFITVDIGTRCLADTGRVDVFGTVQKLRSQRALSIQTVDQYIFCHKALVQYVEMMGMLKNSGGDDALSDTKEELKTMDTGMVQQSLNHQVLPQQPTQQQSLLHQSELSLPSAQLPQQSSQDSVMGIVQQPLHHQVLPQQSLFLQSESSLPSAQLPQQSSPDSVMLPQNVPEQPDELVLSSEHPLQQVSLP